MTTVLVLGGTSEARACAAELASHGIDVVSSLAGRVSEPKLPEGRVRIGGFGGPDGLARWLTENGTHAVIDATHPFAERIGSSAAAATRTAEVPLLRLERPGWQQEPGERWHWVDSLEQAAAALPSLGEHAFITTGRQGLAAFTGLAGIRLLVRCVEHPDAELGPDAEVLLSRGPYTTESERALMAHKGIDVLVTKDSGGTMTRGKLVAARELGLDVVIVRRPARRAPETVHDPGAAVRWVLNQ